MEKVAGIGGIFFKASDPKGALGTAAEEVDSYGDFASQSFRRVS